MVNINEEIQSNFKHVFQLNRQQHQKLTLQNYKNNNISKPNKNNNSSHKKNNNYINNNPSHHHIQTLKLTKTWKQSLSNYKKKLTKQNK
jgi:hypothetical protein